MTVASRIDTFLGEFAGQESDQRIELSIRNPLIVENERGSVVIP